MKKTAVKIAVIESERGWGRKIDDYMVCLTNKELWNFKENLIVKTRKIQRQIGTCNVKVTQIPIDLDEKQYEELEKHKRIWLRALENLLENTQEPTVMSVELTKQDLINLLRGTKPDSMQECDNLTKAGYMEFCGNQHNEDWRWKEDKLQTLSEEELWNLYQEYKKQ